MLKLSGYFNHPKGRLAYLLQKNIVSGKTFRLVVLVIQHSDLPSNPLPLSSTIHQPKHDLAGFTINSNCCGEKKHDKHLAVVILIIQETISQSDGQNRSILGVRVEKNL